MEDDTKSYFLVCINMGYTVETQIFYSIFRLTGVSKTTFVFKMKNKEILYFTKAG